MLISAAEQSLKRQIEEGKVAKSGMAASGRHAKLTLKEGVHAR